MSWNDCLFLINSSLRISNSDNPTCSSIFEFRQCWSNRCYRHSYCHEEFFCTFKPLLFHFNNSSRYYTSRYLINTQLRDTCLLTAKHRQKYAASPKMVKVVCILAQYTIYYRTSKIQQSLFYENNTLKKKKNGQNESNDQERAQETTFDCNKHWNNWLDKKVQLKSNRYFYSKITKF